MRVGVLALQGAFVEHEKMLRRCGAETFEIRQKKDIEKPFDGIILPGGESTVMRKLLSELSLLEPLLQKIKSGFPVMGTCAGLILLAENIEGESGGCFGTMKMTVRRNAYGRQLGSFETEGEMKGIGKIPMVFIRAPYIKSVNGAEILSVVDGNIVAARQENQLAVAFHPELTDSSEVHKYFLDMIKSK